MSQSTTQRDSSPAAEDAAVDYAPETLTHTQVYHVRCGRCGATTAHDVDRDTMRKNCPSCKCRLTLPATITARCPSCGSEREYPHTLAGHCTTCSSCDGQIILGPAMAWARSSNRRRHNHRSQARSGHTLAFSDGAERALILIAAAIVTLIFVVAAGLL